MFTTLKWPAFSLFTCLHISVCKVKDRTGLYCKHNSTLLKSQCSRAVLLIKERAKLVIFILSVRLKRILSATSAQSQNRREVLHSHMCTVQTKNYTNEGNSTLYKGIHKSWYLGGKNIIFSCCHRFRYFL